jgi:riboflavin kinase/FMN adenylyltransferase
MPERPTALTIGVFDGVHRGHQHLIRQWVARAEQAQLRTVVLTFFPHPDAVIRGVNERYYLTSPDQKAALVGELGVDLVITHPFDESVRQTPAADFVDQLRAHLDLRSVWITRDFALGYQREGTFDFLVAQGAHKGFEVVAVELLTAQDQVISSSAIRTALAAGEITTVTEALGRPYTLEGVVIKGDQRGRTIGFPTANLDLWSQQAIPTNGVYAGIAELPDGSKYAGVTNIGQRPTFNGVGSRVEVHLLDFDGDLYGQTLKFSFVARLRSEQKFNGIEGLVTQIRADVDQTRALLSENRSR